VGQDKGMHDAVFHSYGIQGIRNCQKQVEANQDIGVGDAEGFRECIFGQQF
jgi:hypothetical protein